MDEWSEADRLEALAHRYVDAARVVALESGRYAVFSMAAGGLLAVVEAPDLSSWVVEACRVSGAAWAEAREAERRERGEGPAVALTVTAEDLGL